MVDAFVFGQEVYDLSEAIPKEFTAEHPVHLTRLPNYRSLNRSISAAILLYEASRNIRFEGGS